MAFCGMGFGAASAGFRANAVAFDGADYLNRGSALTGSADGKSFTFSAWVNTQTLASEQHLFAIDPLGLLFRIRTTGALLFSAQAADSTSGLQATANDVFSINTWFHILVSVNMASLSQRHVYINDNIPSVLNFNTYNDKNLQLTGTDVFIGTQTASSGQLIGSMADMWYDDVYTNLSVESNRRKFISAAGKPVNLGASGEIPTGASPILFLTGSTDSWHVNKGTGGGFTEVGTLTTATTSPSS